MSVRGLVLGASATFAVVLLWFRRSRQSNRQQGRRRVWVETTLASKLCASYSVDELYGFAPRSCLARLPPWYAAWEDIASELPALNRSGKLHDAVCSMPLIEASTLRGVEEQRRAFVILGMIAHSLVNGPTVPWSGNAGRTDAPRNAPGPADIPPQLAVPWVQVASALELPTVLTAAALDLWNWRPRLMQDPTCPRSNPAVSVAWPRLFRGTYAPARAVPELACAGRSTHSSTPQRWETGRRGEWLRFGPGTWRC